MLDNAPAFGVVAIAGSLGAIRATAEILGELPSGFPVPVLVAQHRGTSTTLARTWSSRSSLPVHEVFGGEVPLAGHVYVAPPDRHMMVAADGRLDVASGPRVGHARPSGNVLFSSVAEHFGPRALAVVLSGRLSDGADGVRMIKRRGGRVLVQERRTADAADMPAAALATGCVDFALPPKHIARALVALTMVSGAADHFRVPVPPWAVAS